MAREAELELKNKLAARDKHALVKYGARMDELIAEVARVTSWKAGPPVGPLPCFFFFKVQFRGGHGGHGGHDTRTAPETQRAAASARGRRVQALRCARRAQRAWDGDSRTREASSHAWRPPVMDEPHYPTGVPHAGARMSRYGTQGRLLGSRPPWPPWPPPRANL